MAVLTINTLVAGKAYSLQGIANGESLSCTEINSKTIRLTDESRGTTDFTTIAGDFSDFFIDGVNPTDVDDAVAKINSITNIREVEVGGGGEEGAAISNDILLGSGNAGAGLPYAEIVLGTNLSMVGTTLNATGGGVQTTGSVSDGDLVVFDGATGTLIRTDGVRIGGLVDNVQQNGGTLGVSEIVETNLSGKFITAPKATAYNKNFGSTAGTVLEGDTTSADIPFAPNGDIVSTDVQSAIVEVRDDADTKLSGKANITHTHDTADITSGTFSDARIAESNVTQHESAINHNALANYNITEHRVINDFGSSTTELFSASKILALTAAISSGVQRKSNVQTTTKGLGNITLSGEQTLNGITTANSRVLVTDQTLGEENGIYITSTGAWVRSPDADQDVDVNNGLTTYVENPFATHYKSTFILVTSNPIALGATPLSFDELPPANEFGTTAGTAAEGNDPRIPTQDENDALVGTGTPSALNVFVTDDDARLSTDLSVVSKTSTTLDVASSTGTNATLPSATGTEAGLMPASDKVKSDFISVTQPVDLDTMESDIALNNAKVSNATHTGDVTGSTTLTISDAAVSFAKIQDISTDTILGRSDLPSPGDVQALTGAQVRTIINVSDGATANDTDANLRDRATHTGVDTLVEIATPSNPPVDSLKVYAKDDGGVTKLATLDSAGTETILGPSGVTNLGYTSSAIDGTVTNTAGTDATIPLATPTAGSNIAGLLSPSDKDKLDNTSGTNTGDEAAASETVAGIAEIATVAEVDAGTDNTRIITPLGLAGSQLQSLANSALQSSDIGVSVQAYDIDTAKTDVSQSFTAQQGIALAVLTSGASISWDGATQQNAKVTLTENAVLAAPTNIIEGFGYRIIVISGVTAYSLGFNAKYKEGDGTFPDFSSITNATTIMDFSGGVTNELLFIGSRTYAN